MRVPFVLSFALLAAVPALVAAVPPPGKPTAGAAADPDRDAWRAQAVAICVGDLGDAEGVTGAERDAVCGCTLDRFMAGKATDALPALSARAFRASMSGGLLSCAATQRMAVVSAIASHLAEPPPLDSAPDAAAGGKPSDAQAPASQSTASDPAKLPDLQTWLSGLSFPAWVTNSGLPPWAWAILGVIGFLVLRGLRRGGAQPDLIGPPPNMRLGARANQPAPRRADPPPRG